VAVLDWLQQLLGGGDPEAAGAAQASTAMQPMTQPWLDKVLSGEMARSGIQDVNDAFASRDPVALAGSFGPSPLGIRAFHGSPHSFDRFDLGKIGTGEGAQAYGHGLYFAENPATAEFYRDTVGTRAGPTFNWSNDRIFSENEAAKWLQNNFNMPTGFAARRLLSDVAAGRGWDELRQGSPKHWGPAVDWLEANKVTANPINEGRMYEVDINAKPEDFLNWDKPLAAQPPAAVDIAKEKWWGDPSPKLTGQDIYESLRFKNPADTSKALGEAGIPGIRYSDQGSRGYQVVPPSYTGEQWRVVNHNNQVVAKTPTEQGVQDWMQQNATSNYAIWTPEIITILRRYGLLPPLAAGGLLAAQPGEAAPR
jgi:hypothetical protein